MFTSNRVIVFATLALHCVATLDGTTTPSAQPALSVSTGGIRICCELGSSFYPRNSCQPTLPISNTSHWMPPQIVYHGVYDEFEKLTESVDLLRVFESTTGVPACIDLIMIPLNHKWKLYWNGTIRYRNIWLNANAYCLSPFYLQSDDKVIFPVFACKNQLEERINATTPYVAYCMLASIPFLVITFAVYLVLPELQNVHGKSLMCYLCGLTGTFAGMVLIQMEYAAKEYVCHFLGPATYFLIMFSFFWLNVISFDLWWNFRGTGKLRPNTKSTDLRKFRLFSLYAWLCPLLMVMCSIVIEVVPVVPDTIKPGYLMGSCFLKSVYDFIKSDWLIRWNLLLESTLSEFVYLYMPIVVIMSCNATFFLLTSRKIGRLQREIGMVTESVNSGKHQKRLSNEQEQFGLFCRLYIVMGVTWVLDVVSWTLDDSIELMYLCDLWNALQGPIIFALLVLKANVRRTISKKYNMFASMIHDIPIYPSNSIKQISPICWK